MGRNDCAILLFQTIQDLLKKAKQGKSVDEDDIPPPVAVSAAKPAQPPAASHEPVPVFKPTIEEPPKPTPAPRKVAPPPPQQSSTSGASTQGIVDSACQIF